MVRYEKPSRLCCLPLFRDFNRPFKPKLIRLLLTAVFWIITFLWMVVCGHFATFRYPENVDTLPDILFDVLPHRSLYPIPEIIFYTLLISTVIRMIFRSDGLVIARRFSVIAGCIYVFRSITLVATSLPDPRMSCNNSSWSIVAIIYDKCGDMMGHTVNLALAALVWGQYTKNRFVSVLAWLASLTDMILFIMSRSHYTLDVLISLGISIFFWKYYHMVLKLPPHLQNSAIVWLEKFDFAGARDEARGSEGVSLTNLNLNLNLNEPVSPVPSRYKELVAEAISISTPANSYKELVEDNNV